MREPRLTSWAKQIGRIMSLTREKPHRSPTFFLAIRQMMVIISPLAYSAEKIRKMLLKGHRRLNLSVAQKLSNRKNIKGP
jgi:hypothetical protein